MPNDDITDKVREWLGKQGYPLELRTGRVFEDLGWNADHRTWYTDPTTGATREVDVFISRYVGDETTNSSVAFDLVVECKRSIDKPWVALSSPVPDIQFLRKLFPNSLSQDADHAARFDGEASLPSTLMPRHGRIGHGIVAAFTERGATAPMSPYSAVRAVAACFDQYIQATPAKYSEVA